MSEQPPALSEEPSGKASPNPGQLRSIRDHVGLPAVGWEPMSVLLGIFTAVGITVFGTFAIAIFDHQLDSPGAKDLAQLMVAVGLVTGALIFATAAAGGRIRRALAELGLARFALRALGMAALAWLLYVGIAQLLAPLLHPEQQDVTREIGTGDESTLNLIIGGFLIVIAAPLSEEIFFRGFMFAGLRRSLPIWAAAAISGLVWGSLHLSGGNVGVALQLALFGVVLAFLYERSGTLWAPICAHAINNTIAFVVLVAT